MSNQPSLDDRVQTETVNHKGRTAFLFGLFCGVVLGVVMYLALR